MKKILYLTLLLFVTSTVSVFSQEGVYRIVSISTVGNKTYDSRTIAAYSGLKVGDEISIPSDVSREALQKLWNLGLFSDVQLYIDQTIGSEAYVVIQVAELPRVESVQISGNDHFSDEEIREKANLVPGEVISQQRLKDIEYALERAYTDDGYSMAKVTVDQLLSANNEARVRIKVVEGEEMGVAQIRFEGNRSISSDDLKDALEETSEGSWWKFWESNNYDKKLLEADLTNVENYYKERGFKDAEVIDYDVVTAANREDVIITIKVDEGSQYRIGSITFEGNKLYSDTLLLSRVDLNRGDIYNVVKLQQNLYQNESETDISSLYLDNGYLAFNADVEEKVNGNRVDLIIRVTENNQYRFNLISFQGNEKTKDKVLRRELYTVPGDYFNKTNIKRSLQQLNALNYFNPEKLGQDIQLENDSTVNLTYMVEERSSDQFNASVGYSGSFGVTGSLGLTFNNFDITRPFKGGAGQILNFNWQFGESGSFRTFNLGFTEPWLFDTPTLLGINLYDTEQDYSGLNIRETGGILNLGRRFKFPDDYFRGDWAAKYQRTDTRNGADIYEEGIRTQVSLRQTISRSTVFDPIFPITGTKVSNSTELSGGPFLPGNIEFIKNIFTAEAYTPVFRNERLVLYSNFNFSYINSIASDNYLPPNEVFFMGGNGLTYNTIALRGYDDRNIGPKNNAGNPIGGRVAMKYSLELRYPLSLDPLPIFILGFVDAGNVWSDIAKTDPFNLRRSAGIGARLLLPAVGLVGFDFGYGFDRRIEDNEDPKWLFHFQFGRGF